MKNFGILALACTLFYSCQKKHPSGYLSFSGKLENASDSVMYISGYGLQKKIMVNEHGFFSDSLVVEKPNLYTLSLGNSKNKGKVYFKNGYDLYVTIDATNFYKSFQFKGNLEGAHSNNFVVSHFKLGEKVGNTQQLLALDKEAFLAKIAQYKGEMDHITSLYNRADPELIANVNNRFSKFFTKIVDYYDRARATYLQQQKAIAHLKKGNPAPEFNDFEHFDGGTKSLKDFRGNYVYIDVWATWCRPCIAEIPYLQRLEKQFEGKNISFVSISTDNDRRSSGSWEKAHSKWYNMVKAKNLGGTQLWAGKEGGHFSSDYYVNSIPRFILIDPEGNLINHNERRPSHPDIAQYLISQGVR